MFVDVPGERGDYLLEASSSDNSRLQVSKFESRNLDPGLVKHTNSDLKEEDISRGHRLWSNIFLKRDGRSMITVLD